MQWPTLIWTILKAEIKALERISPIEILKSPIMDPTLWKTPCMKKKLFKVIDRLTKTIYLSKAKIN